MQQPAKAFVRHSACPPECSKESAKSRRLPQTGRLMDNDSAEISHHRQGLAVRGRGDLLPGCMQTEVVTFDEASVELLERDRFYRRYRNHSTD